MKTFKCIIVEDEKMSRDVLKEFISRAPKLELIGEYASATNLVSASSKEADVLFLDIELPELNGFELLEVLGYKPYVIVITAHEEYAIKGFEYSVNDFMLKPFTQANFLKAIAKLNEQSSTQKVATDVFIKVDGNLVRIPIQDILYMESFGDYVHVYTKGERQTTRITLKEIEENLPDDFMRIHRSFIVNISKIDTIEDNVLIIEKSVIPISRNLKQTLLERLNYLAP